MLELLEGLGLVWRLPLVDHEQRTGNHRLRDSLSWGHVTGHMTVTLPLQTPFQDKDSDEPEEVPIASESDIFEGLNDPLLDAQAPRHMHYYYSQSSLWQHSRHVAHRVGWRVMLFEKTLAPASIIHAACMQQRDVS